MNEFFCFLWEIVPRIAAGITILRSFSRLAKLVPKKMAFGSLPNIV
jgi:hypothetical protein